MPKTLSARTLMKLAEAHQAALHYAAAQYTAKFIIERLRIEYSATFRYVGGTTILRCAGVETSNTRGDEAAMLKAWRLKAQGLIEPQPADAGPRALEVAHG